MSAKAGSKSDAGTSAKPKGEQAIDPKLYEQIRRALLELLPQPR